MVRLRCRWQGFSAQIGAKRANIIDRAQLVVFLLLVLHIFTANPFDKHDQHRWNCRLLVVQPFRRLCRVITTSVASDETGVHWLLL